MQKNILLSLVCAVLFFSCSDSVLENEGQMTQSSQLPLQCDSNHISFDIISKLANAQNSITRASGSKKNNKIECIVNKKNKKDTLLYIVQKEDGGWTMYSSDSRIPPIVAQSSKGKYADVVENEAAKLWIESMAEDIAHIKKLGDEKLKFTKEEIKENKKFWKSISDPDGLLKAEQSKLGTRGTHDDLFIYKGHWELIDSKSYGELRFTSERLTTTDWHQENPFNEFCPYKSNNITRAPAGCIAIAAAQMLFFLHNKFGVPATAPALAYCNGNVNSEDYDWDQTNFNSLIWIMMEDHPERAAPLIANVGKLANVKYGDDGSRANFRGLVDNVFLPYDIDCTYCDYDSHLLVQSLYKGIPVLLSAKTSDTNDGKKVGHAFIADRYKEFVTVTENIYEWHYDNPPSVPVPYVSPKTEYSYSSPYIGAIGMNWGWEGNYNNEGWYGLTSDWYVEDSKGKTNWNIQRTMIYNFTPITTK